MEYARGGPEDQRPDRRESFKIGDKRDQPAKDLITQAVKAEIDKTEAKGNSRDKIPALGLRYLCGLSLRRRWNQSSS